MLSISLLSFSVETTSFLKTIKESPVSPSVQEIPQLQLKDYVDGSWPICNLSEILFRF